MENNMLQNLSLPIFLVCLSIVLIGCGGEVTFNETARAGDTITVAAGRQKTFAKDNMTVVITPSSGSAITYGPNHSAIRAVVNLYPDVLSSLHVSMATGRDVTPDAFDYATVIRSGFADGENDYWQTSVFIDLPTTLPLGITTIDITTPQGESASSVVNIIDGTGVPHSFRAKGLFNFNLTPDQLDSMSRVPHYTIDFTATTVPHSIQIEFSHDADMDNGGVGRIHVVNPRGDIKNLTWADDGITLKTILYPARDSAPTSLEDFKFYVAGGITNLALNSIDAFDDTGNSISGVSAIITPLGM